MCILDLMYEFHYNHIKNKYGNNLRWLFSDTESLMYEIKMEDLYEDFSKDKEVFDLSNCSSESKYYDDLNKLVVGKMKYETNGVPINEFVRLKPKIYSFLADDSSEHENAKDMNKNIVATIIHGDYKDVLFNKNV